MSYYVVLRRLKSFQILLKSFKVNLWPGNLSLMVFVFKLLSNVYTPTHCPLLHLKFT